MLESCDVKRYDHGGMRLYYPSKMELFDAQDHLKPSATSVLRFKNKPYLGPWYRKEGRFAEIIMNATAMRGDIVHICINKLNNGMKVDISDIKLEIFNHSYKGWFLHWDTEEALVWEICRYLHSYITFYEEYKPEITGTELMLYHEAVPWAGTEDICMKIDGKTVLCDIKTGSPDDDHKLQLIAYKLIHDQCYQEPIDSLMALYLKDTNKRDGTPSFSAKTFHNFAELRDEWMELFTAFKRGFSPTVKPNPPTEFQLTSEKEQ